MGATTGERLLPEGVEMTFRPAAAEDVAWCYRVYASGMHKDVDRVIGWVDADQQRKFVSVFRPAEVRIVHGRIGRASADVGWVQVEAEAEALHVKELHIVGASRGLGLGAWALGQVIDEAAAVGKAVRLAALAGSPALSFYRRLGFEIASCDDRAVQLRWDPGAPNQRDRTSSTSV